MKRFWQKFKASDKRALQAKAEGELRVEGSPQQTSPPNNPNRAREIGGPRGAEPTRYGDWERNGRCIDF